MSEPKRLFAGMEEALRDWWLSWEELFAEAADDREETADLELNYRHQKEMIEAEIERLRAVARSRYPEEP
jgi:hypothetical protein